MSFIKTQKVVRNEDGTIHSGSASIVDTEYIKTGSKNHSCQHIRERLGKVLYLNPDGKSGVFLSPTRGLVAYDACSDIFEDVSPSDPRLSKQNFYAEPEIHTVFGDVYLLILVLEKSGLLSVLRTVFPKDEAYERVLCHVLHGVLRDGSRISCENFIQKSAASYFFPDIPISTLRTDSRFFSLMGNDDVKVTFFKTFIQTMQKDNPNFGKGCYVDSTPLPNDIEDNPFNALCCHGVSSSEVMMRLILVLDELTGLPVWYDIIPGNILDINTITNTLSDVADTLHIEIESLVLDAGYISKELIEAIHIGSVKSFIGRMPARKGYPYKTLYWESKELIGKGKYAFSRKHHVYFGIKRQISLFGNQEFAYVYVDQYNALKRFSDYLSEHEEEFQELKTKDKDWLTVKFGYFILVSNLDKEPKDLLDDYFGRTDIETMFKTSKEYLELLPLSKWTDETVRGKILHDVINTIVLLKLRHYLANTGLSTSEIFGKTQALMCSRSGSGYITVETPTKKVKEYYNSIGLSIPSHLDEHEFRKKCLIGM